MTIKCTLEDCPKNKDICCLNCSDSEDCKGVCNRVPGEDFKGYCPDGIYDDDDDDDEQAALVLFNNTYQLALRKVAHLITTKKQMEEEEKALKDSLKEAMEAYGIKSFDSDILKITYVAPTTAISIDSVKLKKKYPAIADECSKESARSAYVKVEVKK